MDLYLIRHPPVAVDKGICYGASDVELAEPVSAAAGMLRPLLPERFSLFSSPLLRCRLLAEALGRPQFDARLQEIDFGTWELQSFDAIGKAALDRWAADAYGHRPPGGESASDMVARVRTFMADLAAAGTPDPVLIVAHGGPLRAIAGSLLGLPQSHWLALDFAPARLARILVGPCGASLKLFNR